MPMPELHLIQYVEQESVAQPVHVQPAKNVVLVYSVVLAVKLDAL
jgi:hypothetical protein